MVASAAAAASLFFVLWWMLQSEDHPWVPAGLAASVVMLVAASAREVVMRRAWTRHVLEENATQGFNASRRSAPVNTQRQTSVSQTEALRVLEQHSKDAEGEGSLPEAHLKVFQLCGEFLETADRSLASPAVSSERRLTVRARQERVRALQKHHMLSWARNSARLLTHQAHQQARLHEKIESANRALDCIDTALKSYPDNEELRRSGTAVREFMTSSRVAHWVELAQRATFKGRYRRAIDCYRDALFYLTRAGAEHQVAADQITREIELLRARMKTAHAVDAQPVDHGRKRRQTVDEEDS
jgi:tetratricopeptide (TPR) repeat protein